MKLLALDPSSTRTGYAFFEAGKLADLGALTASDRWPWRRRVRGMAGDLRKMLAELGPLDAIVVEVPSGHVADRMKGRKKSNGAGLSIYGIGVGYLLAIADQTLAPVHVVEENDWTRGVPKEDRAARTALIYPLVRQAIETKKDAGLDIADAAGLGHWWLNSRVAEPRGQLQGGLVGEDHENLSPSRQARPGQHARAHRQGSRKPRLHARPPARGPA